MLEKRHRTVSERRQGLRHRVLSAITTMAVVASMAGCGALWRLVPNEPWRPSYVVNRDDHHFVGSRCNTNLIEAGIFLTDPWVPADNSADFSLAIWHALSQSGVPEFELFAPDQPGVSVVKDDRTRPTSTDLLIYINGANGYGDVIGITLDILVSGQVSSYAGLMTWDEFMNLPNSDFGCR